MMRIVILALVLFFTVASVATEGPLARVGAQEINSDQLEQAWYKKNGSQGVTNDQVGQVGDVLVDLIQFELLSAEATRLGYEKKPEMVKAIQRLIVEQYMLDTLVPELEAITVSDEDMEAYYQTEPGRFALEPSIRGALIQVSVAATVSPEKKAELRKRAETARTEGLLMDASVSDFGGVAVKFSDHQATRYRGGDVGWLDKQSRWSQLFQAEYEKLGSTGVISEVLETDDGFYVLKVIEAKPGGIQTFASVREQIRHQLFRDKRQSVEDRFYADLAGKFDVQFSQDSLDQWLTNASARMNAPPSQPD
jgi:parvulin-like peptidyl-prolyl isomerase